MKMKRLVSLVSLVMVLCLSVNAATILHYDFEDGTPSTPMNNTGTTGQIGSMDISGNNYHMYAWSDVYGPSFSAEGDTPFGVGLSSRNAGQDGYTVDAGINTWSPTEWTIELSVKLYEVAGWKTIIGRDGSSQSEPESDFYLSSNGIDDKFRLNIDTVGGNRYILDGDFVPQTGQWYGLAVTSNGTDLTMYVDIGSGYTSVGSLAMTGATVADNALAQGGYNWTFGRGWYNTWFVDYIDGNIDDIRFSDVALDPSELIGIPEPATLLIFGVGALAMVRNRKYS